MIRTRRGMGSSPYPFGMKIKRDIVVAVDHALTRERRGAWDGTRHLHPFGARIF